ncbi:MAG: hypothetical protein ACRDWY_04080 [Actinomycetes bacterium]
MTNARQEFRDAVCLWRVSPSGAATVVIDAATECLVAGEDTPTLRELAGASPRASAFILEPLITDTVNELGMADLFGADVQVEALRAMLRRLLAGKIAVRDLASWAHREIGHDGARDCQPFVVLDDEYVDAEVLGHDERDMEGWAYLAAEAFLDGEPLPESPTLWSSAQEGDRNLLIRARDWLRGFR